MTTSKILLEKNVPCTMRDGIVLYADIYRPDKEGTFPVLLSRLPYSKDKPLFSHRYLDTNRLVENGYVVIIQDVRGRYQSEGEFQPFQSEAKDGYDTVEWAASLPYSSGKVGMFGLSYYGFTQLLAATERPPHLAAMMPAMTLNDQRKGMLFQQGAYGLGLLETWTLESMLPDLIKRKYGDDKVAYAAAMLQMGQNYNRLEELYRYAPFCEWPPVKESGVADFFFDYLRHDLAEEDFWEKSSITDKYEQIQVPAYHVGGWYDCLLGSTIENFTELREKAAGSEAQAQQKLIIGPWGHGDFSSVIGERSFGIHASGDWIDFREDLTHLHLRWFDYWLKGVDTHVTKEPPVKIFVMGVNQWRNENEWPLARTQYVPYYFHSGGNAPTRYGDGSLSTEAPTDDEPTDQFVYNPGEPVPTQGGATLYAGVNTMGPQDQRKVEERKDVLVYTSEPVTDPLEVTGPVTVYLWAATDAKDTDFTAKLVDVLPDGRAYNLTDGIIRARYRNGYRRSPDLQGEVVAYEIDLWATSNVFLPGHRIRVEISSSNFPRFDANPNTGSTMKDSDQMKLARQTIYHTDQYPSHILLPVIPAKGKEDLSR
ncbi:CocE/NonD family hydrolase [Kroppenstedtia pulmonis]|uniref:CocE/NonD family hydrolase n=1 Tax=Kroppenstedtia pulmonis TaxID=1380685 RepID=A0A7D3XLI8_9BACL|nr:CocE/NonD family hydrolase [Kroppenstedtia pulmonis]QKG83749.1 CocE/NonD family hydrolase [Kroppenstedtia pulmonis]